MRMEYCHMCQVNGNLPEAYEKLISDIIDGDRTLFTRWDEIEHAWRFIDEIKNMVTNKKQTVVTYEDYSDVQTQIKERYGVDF
jgi:glucose-6-phosphate 1-dehydrogenase